MPIVNMEELHRRWNEEDHENFIYWASQGLDYEEYTERGRLYSQTRSAHFRKILRIAGTFYRRLLRRGRVKAKVWEFIFRLQRNAAEKRLWVYLRRALPEEVLRMFGNLRIVRNRVTYL